MSIWSIRTKLQIEGRCRDLAMFNLTIDSKLRGQAVWDAFAATPESDRDLSREGNLG